ncbi:hypothetical protein HO173_003215 [Letharia columbiana]|uniref:Uncharacterized protein n=1 Tax=Letharia columbiana TaxID=112416 RepID=A0A8H6L7P2_9LECA|nr:uncharacterized protein HO173_003215 [Letharia columbiana]KAF6238709.1 hypothetical protein HO173_003215 [Letharia columbiana]
MIFSKTSDGSRAGQLEGQTQAPHPTTPHHTTVIDSGVDDHYLTLSGAYRPPSARQLPLSFKTPVLYLSLAYH